MYKLRARSCSRRATSSPCWPNGTARCELRDFLSRSSARCARPARDHFQGRNARDLLRAHRLSQHRLALGVPESADFGSDKMFALDADLDEMHAIDFEKGCYVGQELTARMKHRGTSRKRLLPVRNAPAAASQPVTASGKDIGEMVSAGFALIRLDRLDEANGAPVMVGGNMIDLVKPSWLFA